MRIVLLLLLLLFALPEPLRSEALPQWKAALLFGEPDASSQGIRQEIARELRTKVKALLAFLPNLKPSQILRLAAEREAANKLDKIGSGEPFISKAKQIMFSPDFQLETLRNALSTLEASMNCVLQANVRVRRELQCWAQANHLLTDVGSMNEALQVLERAGVVSISPKVAKEVGLTDFSLLSLES